MAVVMVIGTISRGDAPAMRRMIERCCQVLEANRAWRAVQVVFRDELDDDQVGEAMQVAHLHHLRCQASGAEIVLEVPQSAVLSPGAAEAARSGVPSAPANGHAQQ